MTRVLHDVQGQLEEWHREASYLRIASNHFRRRLIDLQDAEEAERLCAAIDAVVQAEGYVESNVNVPLVVQQFASALEGLFSISPSPAGRGPG